MIKIIWVGKEKIVFAKIYELFNEIDGNPIDEGLFTEKTSFLS